MPRLTQKPSKSSPAPKKIKLWDIGRSSKRACQWIKQETGLECTSTNIAAVLAIVTAAGTVVLARNRTRHTGITTQRQLRRKRLKKKREHSRRGQHGRVAKTVAMPIRRWLF